MKSISISKAYKRWKIKEMVILRSQPCGNQQNYHRDYNSSETGLSVYKNGYQQAGILIALEDKTFLKIKKHQKEITISLKKGDALVFSVAVYHMQVYLTSKKTLEFTLQLMSIILEVKITLLS